MVIGVCTLELDIGGSNSLKEKRGVIKPIIHRLRKEFNVSVAEVDMNDAHRAAVMGIACVSNDERHAHSQLMSVLNWLESNRLDCELVDWQIEIIHVAV